jgi:hypothetical protein
MYEKDASAAGSRTLVARKRCQPANCFDDRHAERSNLGDTIFFKL